MKTLILLIGMGAFIIQWQAQKLNGKDFPKEVTSGISKSQPSVESIQGFRPYNYRESSMAGVYFIVDSTSHL